MKKLFFIITAFILGINNITGQELQRQYRTLDYMESLNKSDTSTNGQHSKIERQILSFKKLEEPRDIVIPIVFHVLYASPAQKIPIERIANQMQILNDDFASIDGNTRFANDSKDVFNALSADTRISFCFPLNSPNHKPTTGIEYHATSITKWKDFESMKKNKDGVKPWNTNRYINVWIVQLEDGNSGFAQMPWGPSSLDGIVIDHRYISSEESDQERFGDGHTLTHLIGNYMGLYPLWGPFPCGDDYVNDTPIHNSPNYRCPDMDHISTCQGNPSEMTMNFMDNTDDQCLTLFTRGQMLRMQAILSSKGPRSGLLIEETDCNASSVYEESASARSEGKEAIENEIEVFEVNPNPVSDLLFIEYFSNTSIRSKFQLSIYDVSGVNIYKREFPIDQRKFTIDVSSWIPGMYIINLEQGDRLLSKRVIVQ